MICKTRWCFLKFLWDNYVARCIHVLDPYFILTCSNDDNCEYVSHHKRGEVLDLLPESMIYCVCCFLIRALVLSCGERRNKYYKLNPTFLYTSFIFLFANSFTFLVFCSTRSMISWSDIFAYFSWMGCTKAIIFSYNWSFASL